MSKELTIQNNELGISAETMQSLLLGDLSGLTNEQRIIVYKAKCEQIGISWLDSPFMFALLNNKMVFVATKKVTNHLVAKYQPKKLMVSMPIIQNMGGHDCWVIEANILTRDNRKQNKFIFYPFFKNSITNDHLKAETKVTNRLVTQTYGGGIHTVEEMVEMGSKIFKMESDGSLTLDIEAKDLQKPTQKYEHKPTNNDVKATEIDPVYEEKVRVWKKISAYMKEMQYSPERIADIIKVVKNANAEQMLGMLDLMKQTDGGEVPPLVETENI